MEPTVFRFILRHSLAQQVQILALTLASFPFLYLSLDLPKRIVNDALAAFDPATTVAGVPVDRVGYLMLLSFLFLLMVVINGLFKYVINTFKGRVGERMLRRLRYSLYEQILIFPLAKFKKTSSGEIIPIITSEVEPLGGFIADAIAQPVFQGGTLCVYLAFIFIQDPVLGLAAVALYPFQGWIIPHLQRKINQLGKQRVQAVRQISERIGETVTGIQEIHNHGTAPWHRADMSNRFGDVFDIRFEIYQRKFFMKFLNNFINQLTPFFFYSIGGYLVLTGDLSFGALVAVLAAYKDLASPWRELLIWYQQKEDARIKYDQVIEQFRGTEAGRPPAPADAPDRLTGALVLSHVGVGEDSGTRVVEDVSCTLPLDRHTAVVNAGGGGQDEFALVIGRLIAPDHGGLAVDGVDYARFSSETIGRRVATVGPGAVLFAASLLDNILYSLRRRPAPERTSDALAARDPAATARRRRRAAEALAAGNPPDDAEQDWVDPAAAGCTDRAALWQRLVAVLETVGLAEDVVRFGLAGTIDPAARPEVARRLLDARHALAERLAAEGLEEIVVPFAGARFNPNATVAENILFGTPVGSTFALDRMAAEPYVRRVLDQAGLTDRLVGAGLTVAETMLEMFAELSPGHELFERFSFVGADELPGLKAILDQAAQGGTNTLGDPERTALIGLVLRLIPARHRLGVVDDALAERILQARRCFARDLPPALSGAVAFFDPARYNAAISVQDNILFGRFAYGETQTASRRVRALLAEVIDRMALRPTLVEVGLDHQVGVGGQRLSAAQRQKAALARALIKDPDLLVLNEATAVLDSESQAAVHEALLAWRAGRGLVWFVHRPTFARRFDQVIVLRHGRVVEAGGFDALVANGGVLAELLEAVS